MKKILSMLLVFLTTVFLVSCQGDVHTIYFDVNGGSPQVTKQEVKNKGFASHPEETVTKEGYSFAYWFDSETEDQFLFEITEVTKDYILVAYWNELPGNGDNVEEEFTVTFIHNDDNNQTTTEKVQKNKFVTKPNNPTKEGYIFQGWYTDLSNSVVYDFDSPITANLKLYAKWEVINPDAKEFTVTYITNGGSNIPAGKVYEGSVLDKPTDPTKENFSFVGWYSDITFNTKYDFNSLVTKNLTLYAKWEEDLRYTVTFETNGGSNLADSKVYDGAKLQKPNNPTKSGFVFDGWYIDQALTSQYDFNKGVKNNFTLYAKWKVREQGELHSYYQGYGFEDMAGSDLREALKVRLNKGAVFAGYGGGLNPKLIEADKHPTVSGSVYTIYDGEAMKNSASGSSGPNEWNKEHVMPQSWYTDRYPKRKGDLHNLRIARASINSTRGNLSFAQGSGDWSKVSGGFYPGDGHQGDSARIAMYMILMLPDAISVSRAFAGGNPIQTMLRWHLEDPVDDFEIRRNDVLFGYQKNRNPFIDHPEFAELIWGSLNTSLTNQTKLDNLIVSTNLVVDIIVNQEIYVPNTRFYF